MWLLHANLHIYVASPAESAVHDQIDHGSIKFISVLSQCSFPCVVPLPTMALRDYWSCRILVPSQISLGF